MNPLDLPLYLAVPLACFYLLAWLFIGSLWAGFFNNVLVRKNSWKKLEAEDLFFNCMLWPLFMGLALFFETAVLLLKAGWFVLAPLAPVVDAYLLWIAGERRRP